MNSKLQFASFIHIELSLPHTHFLKYNRISPEYRYKITTTASHSDVLKFGRELAKSPMGAADE